MKDTWIVFPEHGGVVVTDMKQLVDSNDYLTWHVVSENPDVKKVRIEFDRPDAGFFPMNGKSQNWYEKELVYEKDKTRGEQQIWGQTPGRPELDPKGNPVEPVEDKYLMKGVDSKGMPVELVEDKYVVQGLDANGKALEVLDPYIITDRRP